MNGSFSRQISKNKRLDFIDIGEYIKWKNGMNIIRWHRCIKIGKNSTNQNALESIEFYIERMKFYRIFIDVPAIGAGLQGKEPVW